MLKILGIGLLWLALLLPAAAQEEVAGPLKAVLLSVQFSCKAHVGDKETKRVARPTVLTMEGKEAEIRLGGLGEEKDAISLAATPTVVEERIHLKLRITIERNQRGPLKQSCALTASSGERVEFLLEAPEGDQQYTVEVTPYLVPSGQKFDGYDKDGQPIFR